MQIQDLVKTIDKMTDAELHEHIRGMRHRRETIRPAARARVERVEKKATRVKVNKAISLFDNVSEDERLKLIAMLLNGEQQ